MMKYKIHVFYSIEEFKFFAVVGARTIVDAWKYVPLHYTYSHCIFDGERYMLPDHVERFIFPDIMQSKEFVFFE